MHGSAARHRCRPFDIVPRGRHSSQPGAMVNSAERSTATTMGPGSGARVGDLSCQLDVDATQCRDRGIGVEPLRR